MGLIKKSNLFIGEYRTSKEVVFGILNFHITATQGIDSQMIQIQVFIQITTFISYSCMHHR